MRERARRPRLSLMAVLMVTVAVASLLGLAASRLVRLEAEVTTDTVRAEAEDVPSDSSPMALDGLLGGASGFGDVGIGQLASADVTTSYRQASLPEAARDVLRGYEERGDCLLCEAGYLDLQGNVWACVVQGDGWVEVQVVRSAGEGQGSELTVVHMDPHAWAQELDGLMGEDL